MSKETGGPAFPIWHETSVCASGMSIRDYFAGMAMQGLLVNAGCYSAYSVAKEAYEMADAMLKARSE